MSSSQAVSSEWSTVIKNKKSNPISNKLVPKTPKYRNNAQNEKLNKSKNSEEIDLDDNQLSELLAKINLMKEILNTYEFSRTMQKQNNSSSNKSHNINKLVALGIGSFSESPLASIQLSIFLHLSTLLDSHHTIYTDTTTQKPLSMYLYDPSFTKADIKICHALGIQILINRHGKYCLNAIDTYLSTNDTNSNIEGESLPTLG